MQWLVQNSGVADTFTTKLIQELINQNKTWYGFGCTPDGEKLTGLEDIDDSIPTVVFGSTRAVQIVAEEGRFRPGCFYKTEWFDPSFLIGKRDDLLNGDLTPITVGELRRDWITEPIFIKSVLPKVLTGQVIEIEEREDWIEEYKDRLEDEDQLLYGPIHKIEEEYRFFIIDGENVTGSIYRWNGINLTNRPISEEAFYTVGQMEKKYLPSPNIVMDICKLRDGTYKLIEVNCLNSSGLYRSDPRVIIETLEDYCERFI